MTPASLQLPRDSLRAVLQRVYAAPEYEWDAPRDPFRLLRDAWRAVLDWLGDVEQAHPVAYYVLVAALAALTVAILVHLGYLTWRALRPLEPAGPEGGPAPQRPRDAAWYLTEARRLVEAGRYIEALAYRYTALVLELDRARCLTFHPSKTPAEYVAEVRLDEAGRAALRELAQDLYRHVFGGAPLGLDDLVAFDRRATAVARYRAAS